ncbi:MAG: hypothetical protein ABI240_15780 [Sphingomonas sp.]
MPAGPALAEFRQVHGSHKVKRAVRPDGTREHHNLGVEPIVEAVHDEPLQHPADRETGKEQRYDRR